MDHWRPSSKVRLPGSSVPTVAQSTGRNHLPVASGPPPFSSASLSSPTYIPTASYPLRSSSINPLAIHPVYNNLATGSPSSSSTSSRNNSTVHTPTTPSDSVPSFRPPPPTDPTPSVNVSAPTNSTTNTTTTHASSSWSTRPDRNRPSGPHRLLDPVYSAYQPFASQNNNNVTLSQAQSQYPSRHQSSTVDLRSDYQFPSSSMPGPSPEYTPYNPSGSSTAAEKAASSQRVTATYYPYQPPLNAQNPPGETRSHSHRSANHQPSHAHNGSVDYNDLRQNYPSSDLYVAPTFSASTTSLTTSPFSYSTTPQNFLPYSHPFHGTDGANTFPPAHTVSTETGLRRGNSTSGTFSPAETNNAGHGDATRQNAARHSKAASMASVKSPASISTVSTISPEDAALFAYASFHDSTFPHSYGRSTNTRKASSSSSSPKASSMSPKSSTLSNDHNLVATRTHAPSPPVSSMTSSNLTKPYSAPETLGSPPSSSNTSRPSHSPSIGPSNLVNGSNPRATSKSDAPSSNATDYHTIHPTNHHPSRHTINVNYNQNRNSNNNCNNHTDSPTIARSPSLQAPATTTSSSSPSISSSSSSSSSTSSVRLSTSLVANQMPTTPSALAKSSSSGTRLGPGPDSSLEEDIEAYLSQFDPQALSFLQQPYYEQSSSTQNDTTVITDDGVSAITSFSDIQGRSCYSSSGVSEIEPSRPSAPTVSHDQSSDDNISVSTLAIGDNAVVPASLSKSSHGSKGITVSNHHFSGPSNANTALTGSSVFKNKYLTATQKSFDPTPYSPESAISANLYSAFPDGTLLDAFAAAAVVAASLRSSNASQENLSRWSSKRSVHTFRSSPAHTHSSSPRTSAFDEIPPVPALPAGLENLSIEGSSAETASSPLKKSDELRSSGEFDIDPVLIANWLNLNIPKADDTTAKSMNGETITGTDGQSTKSSNTIDAATKELPPAPPEIENKGDRIAYLHALLRGLANRRININLSIQQMTERMPTDSLMASDAVVQKRAEEKRKIVMLRDELAEVQRQEYELALKLHRAYKRLDRDAEFEPTTLWVRRVTT